MRDDILSRCRCEVHGSSTDGHSSGAGRGTPPSTPDEPATPPSNRKGPYLRQGTLYAVEVCWISDGAVTCRTYRVRAVNESRAARIGCHHSLSPGSAPGVCLFAARRVGCRHNTVPSHCGRGKPYQAHCTPKLRP